MGVAVATTTKKDLIERIANDTNIKRGDVKTVVQQFLQHMMDELAVGNRLEFRDFGVFEVQDRAPRLALNPKTLEPVPVPPRKSIRFKLGRLMRAALDGNGKMHNYSFDGDDDLLK
jgi:integration host factor subunit beta